MQHAEYKKGIPAMKSPWKNFTVPDRSLFEATKVIAYAGTDDPFQTLYLSLPKGKKSVPLIIFFHGGGMTNSIRETPGELFNGKFAIAEPRYRLSPHAKAPAQIEDAAKVIAWCFEHAAEYGIDRKKIFVGGMSAGAYLSAISVMDPVHLAPYGLHYKDIAGLILISGQMTTHFRIKADLGRDNGTYNPLIDEYAPLAHLAADLPPILMVSGESGFDMPVRPEENAFMAASLRAMGHKNVRHHILQGHPHGAVFDSCDYLVRVFVSQILHDMEEGN